jgi:hypothetical protein
MRRMAGVVVVAVVLSGCVGPVRSFSAYEGKAATTAESVASAVQAARLAVTDAASGRAFAPYLSVVLAETEGDAGGSGATFAAIQPPDPGSARLRTELLDLVNRAESVLADLRIAVRWGELDRLPEIAAPLDAIGRQLDDFAAAHS